ncbi:MAG TPA: putative toxin-antitoxin system toxin component, PIN family [Thermodesulfobacteriota bacterium]|nr:putative toxin-antitoxin system toxin component, PIN family [Thermodesulfobacteriota bacterium]
MGKKKSKIKVVLDTNVLVSALLFKKETSKIVALWKSGKIVPVLSKEIFDEFKRVLEYPKFALTKNEISHLILEEVLPFFEVIEVKTSIKGICKDLDDDKFISCALSAKARFVVSGDKDLWSLKSFKSVRIIRPSDLLDIFL